MFDERATGSLGSNAASDVARVIRLEPDPSVLSAIGRGHSMNSAVADLVDNSIDAGAERISVRFMTRRGFVESIRISDDGTGMNAEQLMAAMTLGKRRNYEAGALGHFGMGLKSASMSQGGRLQVFTSCGYEPVRGARMLRNDLGGEFEVDVLTERAAWHGYNFGIRRGMESTGTVVEWSQLDAVSFAAVPSARQKWLDGVVNALRGELGLTFHRQITEGSLRIEIDELDLDYNQSGAPRTVDAVDPFAFHHAGRNGYPKTITGELPGGVTISAVCHILPPNSSGPAARLLGKSRLDGQGLYLYRNGRMLQPGGWHSLLPDHRTDWQLARVSINIHDAALGAIAINPEKRGAILRPDFAHALEVATAADGTTFRKFLEDARDTLQTANTRRVGPKPITALDAGLTDDARQAVHEILGSRDDAHPASIRWRVLSEDRLFRFDHTKRTLWMNAGYRTALPGADGLSLSIYLLIERHFAKERPQQSTLDQIEAWQRAIALTTLAAIGSRAFDPTVSEIDDAQELPIFTDVADAEPVSAEPTPTDISRIIAARRDLDAAHDAEQSALRALEEKSRAERRAREAARGELTDAGERMELLADLRGPSDDLIADLRRRINRYGLLTAEEEVTLAKAIEAGLLAREQYDGLSPGDQRSVLGRELHWVASTGTKAFERFAASNLRLVISLAGRYLNHGLDFEDLVQEGALGLIRAIEKFDFTQGFKFSTYATWWIRQALTRALADRGSTIRIPVHMVDLQNKLRLAAAQFEIAHDRKPSIAEVAVAADVSEQEATSALGYVYEFVSIDQDFSDEGTFSLGDVLVDDSIPPEDRLIAAEFLGTLNKVLETLTERERTALRMRYGLGDQEPRTLDYIGDIFDLTRERIRQIEKKAMENLRSSTSVIERLSDYLEIELDRVRLEELEAFTIVPRGPRPTPDAQQPKPPRRTPSAQPKISSAISPAPTPTRQSSVVPAVEIPIEPGSDAHIVDLYRGGASLAAIEAAAEIGIRHIAIRLSRLLLELNGTIDDESLAPRHGLPWEPAERQRALQAYRAGLPVDRIAEDHGRTPLSIAWQLLDSPTRQVRFSKKTLRRLRSSHAGRVRPQNPDAG